MEGLAGLPGGGGGSIGSWERRSRLRDLVEHWVSGGPAFLEDEVQSFAKTGRLSLQRLPVGQAELKALGSVCLVPKRRNW